MGFNKLIISFAMIILFTIALISYVGNFGVDNDAYVYLSNDSDLTGLKTSSKAQMSVLMTDANSSSEAFAESTIASGDETLESGGVFKTPFKFFTGIKNILSVGTKKIFGDEDNNDFSIVFTIISALLVIMIFTATWKLWKGGNPD